MWSNELLEFIWKQKLMKALVYSRFLQWFPTNFVSLFSIFLLLLLMHSLECYVPLLALGYITVK